MIIIRLSGGIGNQLFQYALGRNLSVKNKTTLKFETSDYRDSTRKYSLDKFNIPESVDGISKEADLAKIGLPPMGNKSLLNKARRKIFRIAEYFRPIYNRKFIIEPYFHFCSDILRTRGSSYLSGVWQSEKYFKDNESIIRKELTLKNKLGATTVDWMSRVGACNSISIHIRRGDYATNKKTQQFHGVCPLEYYDRAINLISEKISTPVFFIFSDDVEWVKEHFKIPYSVFYVSSNKTPDYEELLIMSKCKHNIIANSSFSWWGAWLNENKNKIVITPKKWFNVANINTNDLIPSSWVKI